MSVGGSSNLGTMLIRRLDTALSVQASQQSQIVNAARSDAVAQLADAARVNPLHNQTGRPLPESIEQAQAQVQRQGRQPLESARLLTQPLPSRTDRPTTETSTTPSAPTTLGHAAKAILALLARYPGQAPPVNGRSPLVQSGPSSTSNASATTGQTGTASQTAAPSAPTPGGSSAIGSSATATLAGATLAQLPSGAAAPDAQAALFARALPVALQQSGLFYESHLREMAMGARSPAQLKLEPQAQLGRPGNAAASQSGATSQGTASQSAAPTVETTSAEARSTGSASPAAAQSSTALAALHPETHQVVRQQLEVLANQVFGWRGDAWPEAPMEWEVSRQDEQGLADEAGTHWATKLKLTLPQLGQVEARLSLHNTQIVMQLVAPESADTLAQHDQALRSSFLEAGLTLSQLSIRDDEQT